MELNTILLWLYSFFTKMLSGRDVLLMTAAPPSIKQGFPYAVADSP